jgi:hypothetical protein
MDQSCWRLLSREGDRQAEYVMAVRNLGLFNDYSVRYYTPKAAASRNIFPRRFNGVALALQAPAHLGKWHLGDVPGRCPSDRGFDEWYGILRTTDEIQFTSTVGFDP